jgi:hypothetical protein
VLEPRISQENLFICLSFGSQGIGQISTISSSHSIRLEKVVKLVVVCIGVKLAILHPLLHYYTITHLLLIILILGPKMLGFEDFDDHCVFRNNVDMALDLVSFLRAQVAGQATNSLLCMQDNHVQYRHQEG